SSSRRANRFDSSSSCVKSIRPVDAGGHVRGALRPELGRFINVDSAEKKAWTAAAFQRPTEMVRTIALPNLTNNAYGLQHTDSRICIVTGGVPIVDKEGTVLGAIGVAGGSPQDDVDCSMAAFEELGFQTTFVNPHAAALAAQEKASSAV
ncbi:GlcG/HbpS family heme-binding protein, partial [Nocardia salmonicida]|uniref:GlcG/HbpS family heme-binding protein n=1 Tax=Nocardia salmonicida TaxID=53431 RepID=UPI00340D61FD